MAGKTFYAPPAKASDGEVFEAVRLTTESPLVQEILRDVGGTIIVLNQERQIVAINYEALKLLGLSSASQVLGMRPGEALGCLHADEGPNGCGTGVCCRTCGAATAIVTALERQVPIEKECPLCISDKDGDRDLIFRVRASPVTLARQRFVLLFFQDITAEKRREDLERSFFHDLINAAMGVSGLAELLACETGEGAGHHLSSSLSHAVVRLVDEIRVQRLLMSEVATHAHVREQTFSLGDMIDDIRQSLSQHPVLKEKDISFETDVPDIDVTSDQALLGRVLINMLINAAEASDQGRTIRLRVERSASAPTFLVWNHRGIPKDVAARIFQRYFSTKDGIGRGMGTYGMKLIGEKYLGGHVSFETSSKNGTTFKLVLPVKGPVKGRSGASG